VQAKTSAPSDSLLALDVFSSTANNRSSQHRLRTIRDDAASEIAARQMPSAPRRPADTWPWVWALASTSGDDPAVFVYGLYYCDMDNHIHPPERGVP
jgi:hypothetical protein